MRRNFISALPRKCAAFFLESPAPAAGARPRAADGRFQPPNPHRQAGSPPAYWSAAAIPLALRHPYSARRAASKRQSPAPGQSGSKGGRCSPAVPPPPARLHPSRADALYPSNPFLLPQELIRGVHHFEGGSERLAVDLEF